jgi:quercetin dioxygenase-like cupin family protein
MKFPMIHTDEQGETHFGVKDVQDREFAVGPPPNPLGQMSNLGAATTMFVISFPAGTEAPAHNAPSPYIVIVLSGEGEVVTMMAKRGDSTPARCSSATTSPERGM